jgi:hypothetical protein
VSWLKYLAPAVQAVSAVAIVILTYFLARYARQSVNGTDEALELLRDQLAKQQGSLELLKTQIADQKNALQLAREELEQEWRPQVSLFVHFVRSLEVDLQVANLGRTAVQVRAVELLVVVGTELRHSQSEWVRILPVNESRNLNIHTYILGAIQRLAQADFTNYDGNMAARIEYFSAGQLYTSDKFYFGIRIRNRLVREIKPIE